MAARFWVGGAGSLDGSDTTHISATSGGAGGASYPTSSDDLTFDGSSGGGTVTLTTALSVKSITGGAHTGTFNTANFGITTAAAGDFNWSGTGTRTLTLGSSALAIGGAVNFGTNTNLTLTANTAVFTQNASSVNFTAAFNFNGNGMSLVQTGRFNCNIAGSGTCTLANYTRTGGAFTGEGVVLTCNVVCTGTFSATGNTVLQRVLVLSSVFATQRTITAALVSFNNADFQDINAAGAANWDLSGATGKSGDCGGNTGITFTTATTQTWSGTISGSWSANAWTSRMPLPQDDVVINPAFASGKTITIDVPRLGKNIDFSGCTGAPNLAQSVAWTGYGSFTFRTDITISGNVSVTFSGRSSYSLTLGGRSFGGTGSFTIAAPTGTYSLLDDLVLTADFVNTFGSFTGNGKSVTAKTFNFSNTSSRTFSPGTATYHTTGTGTIWNMASSGITANTSNLTIVVETASATLRTFNGGSKAYSVLDYTITGSSGELDVTGNNTFGTINFYDNG